MNAMLLMGVSCSFYSKSNNPVIALRLLFSESYSDA